MIRRAARQMPLPKARRSPRLKRRRYWISRHCRMTERSSQSRRKATRRLHRQPVFAPPRREPMPDIRSRAFTARRRRRQQAPPRQCRREATPLIFPKQTRTTWPARTAVRRRSSRQPTATANPLPAKLGINRRPTSSCIRHQPNRSRSSSLGRIGDMSCSRMTITGRSRNVCSAREPTSRRSCSTSAIEDARSTSSSSPARCW